jgi:hypothetical protein
LGIFKGGPDGPPFFIQESLQALLSAAALELSLGETM